jgi:hypothetical protein
MITGRISVLSALAAGFLLPAARRLKQLPAATRVPLVHPRPKNSRMETRGLICVLGEKPRTMPAACAPHGSGVSTGPGQFLHAAETRSSGRAMTNFAQPVFLGLRTDKTAKDVR